MTKEKRMRMKKEKRRLRSKDNKRSIQKSVDFNFNKFQLRNSSQKMKNLNHPNLLTVDTPVMGWRSYLEEKGHQVNEVVNNGTFGCEVINDLLSTKQKKILEKMGLDKVDLLSVKRRNKGLTSSGIGGNCHSNVRKLVELIGGKQIVGYGIQTNVRNHTFGYERCLQFYGHSVWMTPEGEVIDPTESANSYKYDTTNFIPIMVYQEDYVWTDQIDYLFPEEFERSGYILQGDIGQSHNDMRITFESLSSEMTYTTKKYTEEEFKQHIRYENGGFTKPSSSTGKTFDELLVERY